MASPNAIRLTLLYARWRSALPRRGAVMPLRQRFWSGGVGHGAARQRLLLIDARDRNDLLHLLRCAQCRRWAMGALVEEIEASAGVGAQRLPELTGEERQASEAGFQRARQLARQVGQLAGDARRQAIPGHQALGDRWAAGALIAAAGALLDDWPQAERLAELSLEVVALHNALAAPERRALEVGGLTALLRSRHRLGKLEQADEAWRRALPLANTLPAVDLDRAELLAAVAQLRWTQGALDEAAALLLHAASIFARFAEGYAQAACQLQAAFVLLEQDDPARARPNLEMARFSLPEELAPALAGRCACALAYCRAALGHRAGSAATEGLAGVPDDRGEQVFRAWWLGRAAACAGDHGRAEWLLAAARRQLLAAGSLGEAARCTLDLLLLRVRTRSGKPVTGLAAQILDAFGATPATALVAMALESLAGLAARESPHLLAAADSIRREFAQLPPGEGRPDLIAGLQQLADPLLVYSQRELIEQQLDAPDDEEASPEPAAPHPEAPPHGAVTW
jgi:hypothetical protein